MKDFDFKSFKETKKNKYLKEYCKPKDVKKSKGGIVFLDYKMAGKKTHCVFIPFKKLNEAQKAFKKIKKEKEHKIKKTAFVSVNVAKGADGTQEVTLEVKKGGVDPTLLQSKGVTLFEKGIKMKLNVIGAAQEAVEEVIDDVKETVKDGKEGLKAEAAKLKNLLVGLADDMKNKVKQVASKVKKKEVSQDDKSIATSILDKFEELKTTFDQADDKVKQKMDANYQSIIKYVPQVEKIKKAIDQLIDSDKPSEDSTEETSEEAKALEELLEKVKKEVGDFSKNFDKLKEELANSESEPIEGGEKLLNQLF